MVNIGRRKIKTDLTIKNENKGLINTRWFYEEFRKEYSNDTTARHLKNRIKISYSDFIKINDDFAKSIGDEIILNRYKLYLGGGLGFFELVKCERNFNKKVINFGESNKRKEEILARGGKLAVKTGIDFLTGDSIYDDGEKWIVYYTDAWYPLFWWTQYKRVSKWDSSKYFFIFRNLMFWKIQPIRSLSRRMTKAIREGEVKLTKIPNLYNK